MNVPQNLHYTESHEWIRKEADRTITVGTTDHAQEALGDIIFLELPVIFLRLLQEKLLQQMRRPLQLQKLSTLMHAMLGYSKSNQLTSSRLMI